MTDCIDSVVRLCERNIQANPHLCDRIHAAKHMWGEPVPPPPTQASSTSTCAGGDDDAGQTNKVGGTSAYGVIMAVDCMHCSRRTGGLERHPLAVTLEEACAPDGIVVLLYEPRGFVWDATIEPFVERIERSFVATKKSLPWLSGVDDDSPAAEEWRQWLQCPKHQWLRRWGRRWGAVRMVLLTPRACASAV